MNARDDSMTGERRKFLEDFARILAQRANGAAAFIFSDFRILRQSRSPGELMEP